MRRNENSSRRVPLLQAKRSSERSACPNAVVASRGRASTAIGTPSEPNAVSSDARERSSDGQTIAISSGRVPPRTSSSTVSATSSRVARRPAPSRKRIEPSSGAGAELVVEEVALEVGEPGRKVGLGARRELDDVAFRKRGEVVGRALQRGERRACGLVRERDVHLAAGRKRLDQAPLRAREILEPVGEDGCAAPGAELRRQPFDRAPPQHAAVGNAQPLQLGAVRLGHRRQLGREVAGIEEARLDLGQRTGERIGEARKAGRRPERPGRGRGDELPQDDRPLCLAEHPGCGAGAGEEGEQRVERADGAGEQRSLSARELSLDAIDVDAIRDDQPGIAVEGVDEPVEQKRDLPGVCRADDERETHQPIVVSAFEAASLRSGTSPQSAERAAGETSRATPG